MTSPVVLCHLVSLFIIRMKFHKNKFLTTVAAAALALAVGACSSNGDDDEISMLQTNLDAANAKAGGLQEDLDEANAALMTAQTALMTAQADLDTANGELARLMGEVDTANGEVTRLMGEVDTANAEVTRLMGEVDTANADVTRLMGERNAALDNADAIQAMLDTANGEVTRLTDELAAAPTQEQVDAIQADLTAANDEVTRLTEELAAAPTQEQVDAIQAMLDTANGEVTRLTDELAAAPTQAQVDAIQTMLDTANGEVTRLTGELETANGEVTELTGDLETANGEVTRLTGELETANGEVTRLGALLGEETDPADENGSVYAQLAAAKAQVVTLTTERDTALDALFAAGVEKAILEANAAMQTYARLLVTYEGIDANAATARGLVTAANRAKTEADEALAEAQAGDDVVLTTRAASAVKQADAAVLTANAQLAEATTTAAAMPYAMAIMTQATTPTGLAASATRTGDAVTVSVTSGVDNTLIAKGSASDAGHGWYKANVANEDDSNKTATVYTNIENTMEKFNAVHLGTTDAIDSVAETGVLNLAESLTGVAALKDLVSASNFPGASDGDLTLTYDTGAEKKFDGTFDGVPGEYSCTSTDDCMATANSKGELTGLVGDWTFIPAYLGEDGESMTGESEAEIASREDDLPVPNVAVPDTDYLHFGWWTEVDKDGDVAFQTFAGGSQEITNNNLSALQGTATYKGPAAGRYAVKTFNSNSTLDSIRHGEFTAAAELTASFGGDDIAVNDQNSISGTVTDFASRSDDLSAWSVDLKKTNFADLTDPFTQGEVGGGVGGSPVTSGKWNGQFFGIPAADATDAVDDTDDYPLSVAGEFDAHSSHGHVAGAFGATR